MRRRLLALTMVVLLAAVAGCAGGDANVLYATGGDEPLRLDVLAPDDASGAPVVIYLGDESRGYFDGLVEQGVIVVNAITAESNANGDNVHDDGGVAMRAIADSVACAIHFARERASELGSDDPVVALAGFSWFGSIAAHAALLGEDLEASWDDYAEAGGPASQIECKSTYGSTHVDVLVGMASPYDVFVPIYDGKYGRAYQQARDPDLQSFLAESIANPDLKVRLIHGEQDDAIAYSNSVEFEEALADAGYDVQTIPFSGGHAAYADPTMIMELIGS